MQLRYLLYFLVLTVVFASCHFPNETQSGKPVARVNEKYLYTDDISTQIPEGMDAADSAALANSIIQTWARKQVMVQQAEANLTIDEAEVTRQMEEYRNDLLIYSYQNELINQKLDTVVSKEEVETFYENNKQNFGLKDFIIKVLYVKLDSNAPSIRKVQKWIMSDNPSDREKLENYCYQFSVNFYLDENNWLYLDDLLKEVPLEPYNKENLLKNNKLITYNANGFLYLVRIVDHRWKDSVSPLSLEYDNIKRIILNKRKVTLIEKLEKDLFDKARKNKEFEVYPIK